MRRTLGCGLAVVLAGGLAVAADPAPPADFDKLVRDALQDVHNRGADLYNQAKDYPAAYRLYEGSVRTVRPLLAHRPGCQKRIDDGLAAAETDADPARKAFLLHEAIEAVRAELKELPARPKKADPKPPAPEPKTKTAPPPPAETEGGRLTGTVTYRGKPVIAADVTFVSRDLPAPRVFPALTDQDGAFTALGLPPGRYIVTVSREVDGKPVLPPKFATTDTSGITAEVKTGPNTLNLNLQ